MSFVPRTGSLPATVLTPSSQRQAPPGVASVLPFMLAGLKHQQPEICGWHEGLPGHPDRYGMRLRASASEPKVSALPKLVLPVPRELSDHEQMLEATGHRELAKLVLDGARGTQELLTQGVQKLRQVIARPVMGGLLHSMTVAQFIAKYDGEYEIWVSPTVDLQSGLPGNLLFFGENHADEAQLQAHKKIVFDLFDAKAGARLLLEGQFRGACEHRAEIFGIPAASCVNLEASSPHLDKFKKLDQVFNSAVIDAAVRIVEATPGAARDWPCNTNAACSDFVAAWWPKVPEEHVARITPLIAKANQFRKQASEELERVLPLRDHWMVRAARSYRDPDLFPIGFAGARHIPGMQKIARKTPLITMVERGLWQRTFEKKNGASS